MNEPQFGWPRTIIRREEVTARDVATGQRPTPKPSGRTFAVAAAGILLLTTLFLAGFVLLAIIAGVLWWLMSWGFGLAG